MSSTTRTAVTEKENGKTKRYPHLGFRPQQGIEIRINRLCRKTGMNRSAVINACLAKHLPVLEQKAPAAANTLGLKAA